MFESMEDCTEMTRYDEKKCVWTYAQEVRTEETRFSLDTRMAARRERFFGWTEFVVEFVCVMLVGYADGSTEGTVLWMDGICGGICLCDAGWIRGWQHGGNGSLDGRNLWWNLSV